MSEPKSTPATSWRELYPAHPCADVYPMMNAAEIDTLAEDIRVHGLQQPVVLWRVPVPRKSDTFLVLDGRNRLEALTRAGVAIPSPDDPREMIDFPGGQFACVFVVANSHEQSGSPQVHDPAEFVIGANIRRRHLTKEQQAELIVKTIAVGDPNDRARVARSFSPRRGKKGGSTKDVVLAKAVTEAQKHGISKRTVQNARAKLQGKTPALKKKKIGVTSTPPKSETKPLVDQARVEEMTKRLNAALPADLRAPSARGSTREPVFLIADAIARLEKTVRAEWQKWPSDVRGQFLHSLQQLREELSEEFTGTLNAAKVVGR